MKELRFIDFRPNFRFQLDEHCSLNSRIVGRKAHPKPGECVQATGFVNEIKVTMVLPSRCATRHFMLWRVLAGAENLD